MPTFDDEPRPETVAEEQDVNDDDEDNHGDDEKREACGPVHGSGVTLRAGGSNPKAIATRSVIGTSGRLFAVGNVFRLATRQRAPTAVVAA